MLQDLAALWRLSRPVFLLGGVVLYALGAGVAHAQGKSTSLAVYLLGQFYVTSLQLMTHFLNEYWDLEADRLNQSRTAFTGGSGVLTSGALVPQTALTAARVCLAGGAIFAGQLAVLGRMPLSTCLLMLAMFLGAYFYSSPPLRLAGTGLGEAIASIVVAGTVPWLGLVVAGGRSNTSFYAAMIPLVVIHFAMIMAFEFPDELSDGQAGKRTLLVRIGRQRGLLVHHLGLLVGVSLLAAGSFTALPPNSAFIAVAIAPAAMAQMVAVSVIARGGHIRFETVTLLAIITFSLTAALLAIVFWTTSTAGR